MPTAGQDRDDSGRSLSSLVDRLEERIIANKEMAEFKYKTLEDKFNTYVANTDDKTKLQAMKDQEHFVNLNNENQRILEAQNKSVDRAVYESEKKEHEKFVTEVKTFMTALAGVPQFRERAETFMTANAGISIFREQTQGTLLRREGGQLAMQKSTGIIIAVAGVVGGIVVALIPILVKLFQGGAQ